MIGDRSIVDRDLFYAIEIAIGDRNLFKRFDEQEIREWFKGFKVRQKKATYKKGPHREYYRKEGKRREETCHGL